MERYLRLRLLFEVRVHTYFPCSARSLGSREGERFITDELVRSLIYNGMQFQTQATAPFTAIASLSIFRSWTELTHYSTASMSFFGPSSTDDISN